MEERPSKATYYLQLAADAAKRSTCMKRHYGAVIVKDDRIVSTGYNGAPRGRANCDLLGACPRMAVPNNTDYSTCRSVHAEANAIIHANYNDMIGSTLYLAGWDCKTDKPVTETSPCPMCKRMIINAQINQVIVRDGDEIKSYDVADWISMENDDSIPKPDTTQKPELKDEFVMKGPKISKEKLPVAYVPYDKPVAIGLKDKLSDTERKNLDDFIDHLKKLNQLFEDMQRMSDKYDLPILTAMQKPETDLGTENDLIDKWIHTPPQKCENLRAIKSVANSIIDDYLHNESKLLTIDDTLMSYCLIRDTIRLFCIIHNLPLMFVNVVVQVLEKFVGISGRSSVSSEMMTCIEKYIEENTSRIDTNIIETIERMNIGITDDGLLMFGYRCKCGGRHLHEIIIDFDTLQQLRPAIGLWRLLKARNKVGGYICDMCAEISVYLKSQQAFYPYEQISPDVDIAST